MHSMDCAIRFAADVLGMTTRTGYPTATIAREFGLSAEGTQDLHCRLAGAKCTECSAFASEYPEWVRKEACDACALLAQGTHDRVIESLGKLHGDLVEFLPESVEYSADDMGSKRVTLTGYYRWYEASFGGLQAPPPYWAWGLPLGVGTGKKQWMSVHEVAWYIIDRHIVCLRNS